MADAGDHVLVADDDALIREAVAEALFDAGYRVTVVENAMQGQNAVASSAVDLVIADRRMPGNHELQWIQVLARRPHPPAIIIMTGHPTLETAISSVSLPVAAYLTKPISEATLLAEVKQAVARRRALLGDDSFDLRLERARTKMKLTPRQAEVLAVLVKGAANKEIAAKLGCAVRTVELHVTALLSKSGLTSRGELSTAFWTGL